MTDAPDSDTAGGLAAWLTSHMARTGRPVEAVASELGVSAATVRSWLSGRRPAEEGNEFAHLDTPAKLGAWLRARIADSGSSVKELAESTGNVSYVTVYNWIRGEHLPRPPIGDEPDRFDLVLSNPRLGLSLRQRVQLDEIRRRLTGTSLRPADRLPDWPTRGLPADNRAFTGRNAELRRLDRLLRDYSRGAAVVISALTGIGGIGKTTLAIHWARSRAVQATFTDGCLYLNLNGYADAPPTSPEAALTKLLEQLGVHPEDIPSDPDSLAARYQETVKGKRLLIVLDNAHAEPQVRPLLPTEANCLAVITSRNRLDGLPATHPGITQLPLDTLSPAEARSLLRNLLGRLATRTASEEALDALATACGRLPLALHIAAANYLTHHHVRQTSIGDYAASLSQDRLGQLTVGPSDPTTTVTTTLDRSYRYLTDNAKRMYRLLGLHPGPDVGIAAAASLTGLELTQADTALAELVQANLLTERAPGRFAFHDLLRDHAAAHAERTDSDTERREATARMLDHYVHTAHTAHHSLDPIGVNLELPLDEPRSGVIVDSFAGRQEAMTWFKAEHQVILTAIQATGDFDVHVWQSAWALYRFFDLRGHWHDQITAQHAALAASERLNEPAAQACSHRRLGLTYEVLGRLANGRSHLTRALEQYVLGDDLVGQASVLGDIGTVAHKQGDVSEAFDHFQRALKLFRAANHRLGEASVLNAIGWRHAVLGEYTEALGSCREALGICLDLGNAYGEAGTSDSLGYIHHGLGDHAEALAYYRRARDLHQDIGYRRGEAETLDRQGDLHRSTGDADSARATWQEALDILTGLDHPDSETVRAKLAELDAPDRRTRLNCVTSTNSDKTIAREPGTPEPARARGEPHTEPRPTDRWG